MLYYIQTYYDSGVGYDTATTALYFIRTITRYPSKPENRTWYWVDLQEGINPIKMIQFG